MKRKTPGDSIPEPVRAVRPKIEIMDDDTATSQSAHSNPSAEMDSDTQATEYSDDVSDSSSLSDSSEDSSSDDSSEDSDAEEEEEQTISMPGANATGGASVYTDVSTGLTTVRIGTKPAIDHSIRGSSSSLLKRLRSFLPELEEANKVLEGEAEDGSLSKRVIDVHGEDEEETEILESDPAQTYIEMDLGLGVLEGPTDDTDEAGPSNSSAAIENRIASTLFANTSSKKSIVQEVNETPKS
jgi:hypothetical protein